MLTRLDVLDGFDSVKVCTAYELDGKTIEDFPGGSQQLRDADPEDPVDFGVRFFVLPNPMYGSWEENPPREGG